MFVWHVDESSDSAAPAVAGNKSLCSRRLVLIVSTHVDDLKGAGKPLEHEGGNGVDAAGFRIMAEAGVVPREIELKKAVDDHLSSGANQ